MLPADPNGAKVRSALLATELKDSQRDVALFSKLPSLETGCLGI
jgi:hypothetical protein